MTATLLALHLINLALPAAILALLMVGLAGWLWPGRRPLVAGWAGRLAWTFVLNLGVLVAGLVWLGADGKMATYGALVLLSALAQWVMGRGWRA